MLHIRPTLEAEIIETAQQIRNEGQHPNLTAIAQRIGLDPNKLGSIVREAMPNLNECAALATTESFQIWQRKQNVQAYIHAGAAILLSGELPTIRSLALALCKKEHTVRLFLWRNRGHFDGKMTVYTALEESVYRIGRRIRFTTGPMTRFELAKATGCSRRYIQKTLAKHPIFEKRLGIYHGRGWKVRKSTTVKNDGLGTRHNECIVRFDEHMEMHERIARSVAARFGVKVKDMVCVQHANTNRCRDRNKFVSMVAIYMIKEETELTFHDIGILFGVSGEAARNSHSSLRKISDSLQEDLVSIRSSCGIYH